jgi:hypothetical protein
MEKQVQWLIRDRTPDQLKMNYALWTRQAVSELIEARWGLRLPVRGHGQVSGPLGIHPAEAAEEGLRAVAGGGGQVAQ